MIWNSSRTIPYREGIEFGHEDGLSIPTELFQSRWRYPDFTSLPILLITLSKRRKLSPCWCRSQASSINCQSVFGIRMQFFVEQSTDSVMHSLAILIWQVSKIRSFGNIGLRLNTFGIEGNLGLTAMWGFFYIYFALSKKISPSATCPNPWGRNTEAKFPFLFGRKISRAQIKKARKILPRCSRPRPHRFSMLDLFCAGFFEIEWAMGREAGLSNLHYNIRL